MPICTLSVESSVLCAHVILCFHLSILFYSENQGCSLVISKLSRNYLHKENMGGASTKTNQALLTDAWNLQSAVTLSWLCASTDTMI